MTAPHLFVDDLSVSIGGSELLHGLSFELEAGARLGLIGGSGSGKTLTALAIAGLLPEHAEVTGSVRLRFDDGRVQELIDLDDRGFAALRGDVIGMVFQEPKAALNPLRRLGRQMTESLHLHYSLTRAERHEAALRLAARVGLDDPARIV
ncbi:ATP-binding cassette domain-containing protein, partial [Leucobacter soli]